MALEIPAGTVLEYSTDPNSALGKYLQQATTEADFREIISHMNYPAA